MAAPYIPAQNNAFMSWGDNFASLLTADPTRYGVTAPVAGTVQAAADAFDAAFALAGTTAPPNPTPINPGARTPVTVAAMASQKGASMAIYRTVAGQIRVNPGVTNEDKIALGLNLPASGGGTPVPTPVSYPLLALLSAAPLTHVFSYSDSMTPTGKAKASGAMQLQLVGQAGTVAATDPDALPPLPSQTKSPFQIVWPSPAGGKIASYCARWITRSGLTGPWSPILSQLVLQV